MSASARARERARESERERERGGAEEAHRSISRALSVIGGLLFTIYWFAGDSVDGADADGGRRRGWPCGRYRRGRPCGGADGLAGDDDDDAKLVI